MVGLTGPGHTADKATVPNTTVLESVSLLKTEASQRREWP